MSEVEFRGYGVGQVAEQMPDCPSGTPHAGPTPGAVPGGPQQLGCSACDSYPAVFANWLKAAVRGPSASGSVSAGTRLVPLRTKALRRSVKRAEA